MPRLVSSRVLPPLVWFLSTWGLLASGVALASSLEGLKLPTDVDVAIYLPEYLRRAQSSFLAIGTVEVGRTVPESVLSVAQAYFASSHLLDTRAETHFGLLLSIHVTPRMDNGNLVYTMDYSVYGPGEAALLSGSQSATLSALELSAGGDVMSRTTQQVAELAMTDLIVKLRPSSQKFPATGHVTPQSLAFLADHAQPRSTGTGFFVNAAGQVMTAAHVTRHCLELQINQGEKVFPGRLVASSDLVDLAVVDTGAPATRFLPLRRGTSYELGEPVTLVGYPLQPLLAASPALTRGNVSSRGGLSGAVGQFQFSAASQPGSSGGPVVSDGGELLGVTVSPLGAAAALRQGVIARNVNFALDARYAEMFLRRNGVQFTSIEPNLQGDAHTANEAALAAVVGVKCYE
jgi:S1-C subfamily serine protease